MAHRIGVDVGGTFTDFALHDDQSGATVIHKQLTTPDDPSIAVLEGVGAVLERAGLTINAIASIAHGTTLVTNAVIERRGAVTGMLTTRGFADLLDMGLEQRYDLFDLRIEYPEPLVGRALRRELSERMGYDGVARQGLDADEARAAIASLIEAHGIKSLAVCLLHSYANPAHEEAVRAVAAETFPSLHISTSADVSPAIREFERWTTTTMNAYTQPMIDNYLGRIEDSLADLGFAGQLSIMTSSGGVLAPATARRFPVRMLESGPAAGALMSAVVGRRLKAPDLLSFDMGGTTAKGALVRDGAPLRRYQIEVARVHGFRRGSGLCAKIPAIDMVEIGAGGGSIAEIDERGLMRVGPLSAGADPGPAAYGLGGTAATLSDANLVLGYLDPGYFLGGEMGLDRNAAERAIADTVAAPLDLDTRRAAWGIHEIVNEDVARAFRIHAAEHGFDYRASRMVAFGGSGPLHALAIARKLRIPEVIIPMGAGVMSALGLLASPVSFELSRSRCCLVDDLDAAAFASTFAPLEDEATGFLAGAGVTVARIVRRLDMRFFGQGHEIEIVLPDETPADVFAGLEMLFRKAYAEIHSETTLDEPLEIVSWKVDAVGPSGGLDAGYSLDSGTDAGAALKGTRLAGFGGAYVDCPVYDRYAMVPAMEVRGPALIEERESTCVVGPEDVVRVDAARNLIAAP